MFPATLKVTLHWPAHFHRVDDHKPHRLGRDAVAAHAMKTPLCPEMRVQR
jgi:hypothetical protein